MTSLEKLSVRLEDLNTLLKFLMENGFSLSPDADLNRLAGAIRYYCRKWEQSSEFPFNVSTTHSYPLIQQLLLAENQKESIQYHVELSGKTIGRFNLNHTSNAISSHFFSGAPSQHDDREFSQFLRFVRHVECHIENDCQEFEKVSVFTILRNPSKYPLSKVPFVIKHLNKALINCVANMLIAASSICIFNLATNVALTSSYHTMNEQEIIPFEAISYYTVIYYTIIYYLFLMLLSTIAASFRNEIKAVNTVLRPSETSRSDYGRNSSPPLSGLIIKNSSLWRTVSSDLAENNVAQAFTY